MLLLHFRKLNFEGPVPEMALARTRGAPDYPGLYPLYLDVWQLLPPGRSCADQVTMQPEGMLCHTVALLSCR